jgi:hypothetical protein
MCLWIARMPQHADIAPAVFRAADYRQLRVTDPELSLSIVSATSQGCVLRVASRGYAHAVHWRLPPEVGPSDCYFDLLPGASREVEFFGEKPFAPDTVGVRCINRFDEWIQSGPD